MGLFESLFAIQHRVAASKIRDYALSLDTTDTELALARLLGIEPYRYVAERTYLLPSLCRYVLYCLADDSGSEDKKAASGFLERLFDDYFATRPGVDKDVSMYHWHLARDDYLLGRGFETVAATFLTRLTDGRLSSKDVANVPGFSDVVRGYVRDAESIVNRHAAKVS
jgi:hypothetical protein